MRISDWSSDVCSSDLDAWQQRFDAYAEAFPGEARELRTSLEAKLPDGWDADIPVFPADAKGMATREAGGKVLSAIAPKLPALTGCSADLDPSTYTAVKRSEEHTSELQSLLRISYAVFCSTKKIK